MYRSLAARVALHLIRQAQPGYFPVNEHAAATQSTCDINQLSSKGSHRLRVFPGSGSRERLLASSLGDVTSADGEEASRSEMYPSPS
jgi:hypothetical protein